MGGQHENLDQRGARDSLHEIRRREQQALQEAARAAWPWWYVAGMAALIFAYGAALDADGATYAVYLALCCVAFVILNQRLERSTRVRLRCSPFTGRTAALVAAPVVGFLLAYALLRAASELVLALPMPSTIAGAGVALIFLATAPYLQRGFHASPGPPQR